MGKRKKTVPIILLSILLALFVLHFTQYQFNWIKLKPLHGYYVESEKNKFSLKNWFEGTFQEKGDQYFIDHFGFRSFFVRLNHQWRYCLFNIIKARNVVIGKENYLYEEHYIKTCYGNDFMGEEHIEKQMYKLKMVQAALDKMGKTIIAVFTPGKGAFYPEYIPDRYHKEKGKTNIEYYQYYAEKYGINCIDFHCYFIEYKAKSPYPLFPQYGIHWSYYGYCIAADSMTRYIEKIRNISMPHIYWENITVSQPRFDDNDISKALNLLFPPRAIELAYPEVKLESDSGKTKPALMAVADSFFWGIYNLGWTNLFSFDQFWYYNENIYPDYSSSQLTTKDIDLKDEIQKFDVIIILCTDGNLWNFGWNFIENCYEVFYPAN